MLGHDMALIYIANVSRDHVGFAIERTNSSVSNWIMSDNKEEHGRKKLKLKRTKNREIQQQDKVTEKQNLEFCIFTYLALSDYSRNSTI